MSFFGPSTTGSCGTKRSDRLRHFNTLFQDPARVRRKVAYCLFVACLGFILSAHSTDLYGAEVVPYCEGETYTPCSSFLTSVQVGQHEPIANLGGFTRSKGTWTVDVRYQPEESCARVRLFVNMGPLDFYRIYERVLTDGGGTISDSGTFVHRSDDLESALGVDSSNCHVPDDRKRPQGHWGGTRGAFDNELARQATELGVQLHAGVPGEPQDDLDKELERLALNEQQARQEEERQAQERQRREAEQERQRRREAEARQQGNLEEQLAEINALLEKRIQQELEEQARKKARRQQSIDAGLQTFFGILQGVAELHQQSVGLGDGPSTSDPGVDIIQDDPISPCQRDYRLCESSGRSGAIN